MLATRYSIITKRLQASANCNPGRKRFFGSPTETSFLEMAVERRRNRESEQSIKDEPDHEEILQPKVKRVRDSDPYDPQTARNSNWYRCYVEQSERCMDPRKKRGKKFRRRFRMPMKCFRELMGIIRDEIWFDKAEKPNALGQDGAPLELLVLGALRYLGRGWTFDDLEDATGISEETHRRFFHNFIKACRLHLFPKYVVEPTSAEEIADAMAEFAEAGFDGCIGSADATHIIMEKCSSRLKNQHTGGKLSQTARAFEITVNHRRRILSTTVGFPGRWNDKTIVRFDSFINRIHRGLLYEDVNYELFHGDGTKYPMHGAWILVRGILCK